MAKRKKKQQDRGENSALSKKISQSIRRLGLIDSRCDEETFYNNAAEVLGNGEIDKWMSVMASGSYELNYDFQYSSTPHALVTSVSWRSWPLEVELRWLLPRLKQALERSASTSPYLVEIGAGPGAAAAVASAVLGVPVIATDLHPQARGLPEELAALTGGDVRSETVEALNVADVFSGHAPAAVFGLGVFRYVIPHEHRSGSFSTSHAAQAFMNEPPAPNALHFFDTISPAEVLLAEQMCEDYVGEIVRDCKPGGYAIADSGLEKLFHQIPGERSSCVCIHLTADENRYSLEAPMALLAGPLPEIQPGLVVEELVAEVLRASLTDAQTREVVEYTWPDGSALRRETFNTGELSGTYRSSNLGYRELKIARADQESTLLRELEVEEQAWKSPAVERTVIAVGPSLW